MAAWGKGARQHELGGFGDQAMMASNRFRSVAFVFAALLLVVGGCVKQTEEDGARVYRYELWVPLGVFFGGLVATPIGWALRKKIARLGWGLVLLGPIAAIFFAPSLFRDQVIIKKDGFSMRTGVWGLSAVHNVKFDNLNLIRITAEKASGRRRNQTNYYMNCDRKSGGSDKVPINNAVAQAAALDILREARAHDIPIRDETGGE